MYLAPDAQRLPGRQSPISFTRLGAMARLSSGDPWKALYAPVHFAIVVGWEAILRAIFQNAPDGDLLKLVHRSNSFRLLPGTEPLRKNDIVETKAQINAVLN